MKKFVILCLGRSGSNLLMGLLNTEQSVCFGELYHKKSMYLRFPVPGFEALSQRNADPVGCFRAMDQEVQDRYPNKEVWGFKLFLHHSQDLMEHVYSSADVSVVLLRRENQLARYSSWKKAMVSGEFRKHSAEKTPVQDQPIVFCPKEFEQALKFERAGFDSVLARLEEHGKRFKAVEYCQLGAPQVMEDLYEYLGINGRKDQGVKYHKQGTGYDILERFSNGDQVREYLESNQMTRWLTEQSPSVRSV